MQSIARHIPVAAAAIALLAFVAFATDPPAQLVTRHAGILLEPPAPGKFRLATFQCPVQLAKGTVVLATVPANLRNAPEGTPLSVSEYRTLLFRRTSYAADRTTR